MTGLRSLTVNTASRRAHAPCFVDSLTEAKHLALVLVSHGLRHAGSHTAVFVAIVLGLWPAFLGALSLNE